MNLGKKAQHIRTIYRPKVEKLNEIDFINLSNNQAAYGKYREYPYTYPLYEKLSKYLNVDIDNLLPVRGAEEGIKTTFDAFVEEGMRVIRPNPTFGMLEVYEKLNKAKVVKIEYDENRRLSLNQFISKIKKNSFIYIANPDNPTGSSLTETELIFVINAAAEKNAIVLLDEIYKAYDRKPISININRYPNVIIVGSFSKTHGLAGIRLGYVVADRYIIDILRKLRPMEEVNSIAVKEGVKLLKNKHILKNINNARKWKKIFEKEFPKQYKDTDTNFINLKFDNQKSEYLRNKLYEKRILVRTNFNHPSMEGILRITIGNNKEMRKVLRVLKNNV